MKYILAILALSASTAFGQYVPPAPPVPHSPSIAISNFQEHRTRLWNHSGFCVQSSNAYCGLVLNEPAFDALIEDTPYGPAELGGSGPSRVARYARDRGVRITNVTGSDTLSWIEWSLRNGRPCSITWDWAHVVNCLDMTSDGQWFCIWNNQWRDGHVKWYSRDEFIRRHSVDGRWAVIFDSYPPPARQALYYQWWK